MDSSSDSDPSFHSTDTAAFCSSSTIPAFPNPNDPQYERGPPGEQFIMVDHTVDLVAGVKVSGIDITAESGEGPMVVVSIGIGAVAIVSGGRKT